MSVYDTGSASPERVAEQLYAMRDAANRAAAATTELVATMRRLADLPYPVDTEQEKAMTASAPVVEIIEWVNGEVDENAPYAIPVPNDVRINGVSILCSDDPVIVHEISTTPNDVCRVTITVLARRVVIEQRERELPDQAAALGLNVSAAKKLASTYFPIPAKEPQ